MKKFLSILLTFAVLFSILPNTASAVSDVQDNIAPVGIYANGTHGTNWGDSYAYINTMLVGGALVDNFVWDGNNCTVKLNPDTAPDATLELSFTIGGTFASALNTLTLNGTNIKSAKKGTLTLTDGSATAEIYVKGIRSGTTKTVCFEKASLTPPVCLQTTDEITAYAGIECAVDIGAYFENEDAYYLILENGDKQEVVGGRFSITPEAAGTYTYTFGASNTHGGDGADTLTLTVHASGVESGVWIKQGNLESVSFTDENGDAITGLRVTKSGNSITVNIPRSFALGGKIKANFSLLQTSGLPFISDSNDFRQSIDKPTSYTTTISTAKVGKTFYLYSSKPSAVNNSPTTYTVNYIWENEIPILAEGQAVCVEASLTVGETYSTNLADIFADADGDTLTYLVKINGADAVSADTAYAFTPTLGGVYTLEFYAKDILETSAQSHTVTLTVANAATSYTMRIRVPQDVSPQFYITSGYDASGIDVPGELLTSESGEIENGFVTYTVCAPENVSEISVRDAQYGGTSISAAADTVVTLSKVTTSVTDLGDRAVAGTVTVSCGDKKAQTMDGRFLLLQGGEYTFTATPADTSAYTAVSVTQSILQAKNTVTVKVKYKNPKTITTTTGANAVVFGFSNNYFVHTKYMPLASIDNGDGTTTHYFNPSNDLSYRVSMDGKITKAGYLLTHNSATVLHTSQDALPTDRVDYETAGTDASRVADDSLLLNINQQNHLALAVAETKTIKPYRAWEIINNHLNHIIEPNFHFEILSGEDVITLTPYENQPTVNASGNWRTLTAIGEGTAVVEVTYDAILIDGGNNSGFYGACDPDRTGVFVVSVGADVPDVNFGIESKTSAGSKVYKAENAKPWDCEFDTLYFLGDMGEMKLSPTLAGGTITEVAVSHDKGETFIVLTGENGMYTAPIAQGNNILRVTTDQGIAYQIVRGDKIKVRIIKEDADTPIEKGDTLRLQLVGLHTPIPKIAGTFNPGFAANTDGDSRVHLHYTFGDTDVVNQGAQYEFAINGNTLEITLPTETEETSFTLTDGYIALGVIGVTGFSDDGDSHRNIPDSGSGTRSDKTTFTTRSILPDITITLDSVPTTNNAPIVNPSAPTAVSIQQGDTYAVNLTQFFTDIDGDSMTYTVKVADGESTTAPAYYTFTPSAVGEYILVFQASDGRATSETHTLVLKVNAKDTSTSTQTPSLEFDISGSEIAGYVNISFTDNGKRVANEKNIKYPKALGTIITTKRVPFADGDTVADVTIRLLDALGYSYTHSGTTKDGFYLASIGGFKVSGIRYDSFGEFDAGAGSGWMITLNKKFIEYGASEFKVAKGDVIKWQYTCQLGADIGDPFYTGSSATNINKFGEKTEDKNEEATTTEQETSNVQEVTFADVSKDDWHYTAVQYVAENKLMQGTENGFEPEAVMTRAMLVTVLFRMANVNQRTHIHSFTDVADGEWYSDAIAWAASNGIVSGTSETTFPPNAEVSREQMALMMYRFAKMQGYDVSEKADISSFDDNAQISDWATEALKWANKTALVNGTSETTLSPQASATRAQVAAILMRFCENVAGNGSNTK